MSLNRFERGVLLVLSEQGAYTTGKVADGVGDRVGFFGSNRRQHSACIRQVLLNLRIDGLVTTGDDKKPVVWLRTPKGTEALQR